MSADQTQVINHYEILGVPSHASLAEIEAAYRRGLDRLRATLGSGNPLPASFLDDLRLAYRTLSDAASRNDYDRGLALFRPALATAAPATVVDQPPGVAEFRFAGNGGEYFRIWIVNLLLSILTLGIYSAWAKVRREQYFHRNTLLAGGGFDYHADPRAILRGRAIAVTMLAALNAAESFSTPLHVILLVVTAAVMPWLMMRSFHFRAANTSYRGLRFRHRGTFRQALAAFVGHGLLALVTLGLWTPLWMRAIKRFQLDPLSYGHADFSCDPDKKGFYGTYFLAGLVMTAAMVAMGALVAMAIGGQGGKPDPGLMTMLSILPIAVMSIAFLIVRPFMQVRLGNLVWNATAIDGCRLRSTQSLKSFLPLYAGNLALIVLTLGLYWPWAKVREADYRARHMALAAADLDGFAGAAGPAANAVGEEVSDAFDLDIAI